MKNLKQLLTTPFQRSISKGILIFLVAVTAIGFVDASYLTVEHYANTIPPCLTGGCEQVLTSEYSIVMGIPLALVGAIYYLFLLILLLGYMDSKKDIFFKIFGLTVTLGFVISAYLFFLQAFVIESYCQYCLVSAGTTTILFLTSIFIFKKYKNESL